MIAQTPVKALLKDSSIARSLVSDDGERLIVDEEKLDLFSYFDKSLIPHWEPDIELKPYAELRKMFFDIETDGGLVCDNHGNTRNDVLQKVRKYIKGLTTFPNPDDVFFSIWKRRPTSKDSFITTQIRRYIKAFSKNDDENDNVFEDDEQEDEILSAKVQHDLDFALLDYGLNAQQHSIALIGLMGSNQQSFIINCRKEDVSLEEVQKLLGENKEVSEQVLNSVKVFNMGSEKKGLEKLIKFFEKSNPELIAGYNCFKFDLPFIIKRCEVHEVKHPFYINFKKQTCHKTAQKFGSPAKYWGIYFNKGYKSKEECCIFDLYNQVLAWDFVARKLTSHSLKQAVLQTGLRKSQRTELKFEEMLVCLEKGELNSLTEYLVYDLQDTLMIGDFLIPSLYYQKLFLPDWKLQSISHSGNGSKWNDVLKKQFLKLSLTKEDKQYLENLGIDLGNDGLPVTNPKRKFIGGLTGANKGVYQNISKIDVASLYPSIMLAYGIQSNKDIYFYQLAILKYLLDWRLRLKAKKKNGTATSEEKRTEAAFKVMINSCYGALAAMMVNFNDYVGAALVTAYGRKILRLMVSTILENGGTIVSIDTDGVYYATNDSTFTKNVEIYEKTQEAMPEGIVLDYELEAKTFFVPPSEIKKCKEEPEDKFLVVDEDLRKELEDDEDLDFLFPQQFENTERKTEGVADDGLKKNYIIITWKDLKDKENSPLIIKSKGRFVKRDRCKFEKEYQLNLLLEYASTNEPYLVNQLHQNNLEKLRQGLWDVEELKITRKIRVGEVKMIEYGEPGDVVSYYRGVDIVTYHKKTGKPNKKKIENWVIEGEVGWDYYVELAEKLYNEMFPN